MFRTLTDYKRARRLRGLGDIEKLMKMAGISAFNGLSHVIRVKSVDGRPLLEFYGHIFEPVYEYFDSTCKVSAYQPDDTWKILFDETDQNVAPYRNETITAGSKEAVTEYIRELGNIRIRVIVT